MALSSFSNDAFHTLQSPGAARASTDVRLIRVWHSFPQAVQVRPGPGGVAQGSPCPQLNGSPLGHNSTIALRQAPTCPRRQLQGWAELRQHRNPAGAFIPEPPSSSSLRKPRLRRLTGFPTQNARFTSAGRDFRPDTSMLTAAAGGSLVYWGQVASAWCWALEKFEDNLTLP